MILLEAQSKEKIKLEANFYWSNNGNRKSRREEIIKNSKLGSNMDSISYNQNGKPYLPNGIVFSISHSYNYSLMVVSNTYSNIGIDIEVDRPFYYWEKIVKRFFLESENKYCKGSNGIRRFWEIWVKKEAIIKCLGGSIFENALDINTFDYYDIVKNNKMNIMYNIVKIFGKDIHVAIAYCQ